MFSIWYIFCTEKMTFQPQIFKNFQGSEVVGSSSFQKNIDTGYSHLYRPSLYQNIVMNRHNIGHPNKGVNVLYTTAAAIVQFLADSIPTL